MVQVVEWNGSPQEWNAFVRGASDGTVTHLYGWKAVMEQAYRHPTFYLAALEGSELTGVLPLALVRSPLLGAHLVSLPFVDYGGACVAGNERAELALVETAREIAARRGAALGLRYVRRPELSLPCSLDKVTMLLELGGSEEALWRRLSSERRNRIRKGQKHSLTVSFHGTDGLGDFYAVFSTNMRDLGSPVHGIGFFRSILTNLGEHARIIVVRFQGKPIGAGLMLLYSGMISIPWVSSLRDYFDRSPNPILYWEAMRFGIARGFRVLDFGRSSRDSGTYEAKRQWGASPVQLHWFYFPEQASPARTGPDRFPTMVEVWKRLPLQVATAIGPWLRRGIPN